MNRHDKQLIQDFFLFVICIFFAIILGRSETLKVYIDSLMHFKWLGIVISGMFFTSIFTTPTAIILLGQFAQVTSLPTLALLGGIGAVIGDSYIFLLFKNHIVDDINYLLSHMKHVRISKIFKTRLFKFLGPFIGAVIIASPLPDEVGIALFGLSRMRTSSFFILSFLMNALGIFAIGLVAKSFAL